MGSKVIVQMNGAKTTLLDPSGSVAPKEFTFDFSYWSFDAASPAFATNPKVYSDLGVSVLNNAWSGYNCCLFGTDSNALTGKWLTACRCMRTSCLIPSALAVLVLLLLQLMDKLVQARATRWLATAMTKVSVAVDLRA